MTHPTDAPDQPARREALQSLAGIALAAGAAASSPSHAAPAKPPGKPGDFDFLTGEWRIAHRQRPGGKGDWITFKGEATCWSLLGGVGHVEELRIPERNFSGMGLRLLDVDKRLWHDFWVNAKSGVLVPPGMTGHFEGGIATFTAEEKENGKPLLIRGVWDRITPGSCRWHQAVSRDGGRSWEENWWMDWTRA